MLEVVRDKVCAVSGRVTDQAGPPVWSAEVTAKLVGKAVATGKTDRDGHYTLSRLHMPPGQNEVSAAGSARTIYIEAKARQNGVDFRYPPIK